MATSGGFVLNRSLLRWVWAVAYAVVTGVVLAALSFKPLSAAIPFALGVGAIALFSTEMATVAFVVVASLPILATNALLGVILLVAGLAVAHYVGSGEVLVFVIVATAFLGAALGPVWIAPILAGYLLGSSAGALAAAVACIVLELLGLILGVEIVTGLLPGGADGLVSLTKVPDNLLAFGWLVPAFKAIGADSAKALWKELSSVPHLAVIVAQPAVWAAAAAAAGAFRRPVERRRKIVLGVAASAAGVGVAAFGSALVLSAFGVDVDYVGVTTQAVMSALAAAALIAIWYTLFVKAVSPATASVAQSATGRRNLTAEDADVDELLTLIASAEDKIASQHTTHSVVMITDMKSFSRMTEEEGSFTTAKAVQRHRDLLLPLIEARGGRGKSTGGDGLLASFDSAENALYAAVDMQNALRSHNAAHERERDIEVRIGIADGEVVLDKGGRPFIGAALNLAARVMSLGDGGQILATREVISKAKASTVAAVSHGEFSLKNIAQPVEVLEVLWHEGQAAIDPHTFFAPAQPAVDEAIEDAGEAPGSEYAETPSPES